MCGHDEYIYSRPNRPRALVDPGRVWIHPHEARLDSCPEMRLWCRSGPGNWLFEALFDDVDQLVFAGIDKKEKKRKQKVESYSF